MIKNGHGKKKRIFKRIIALLIVVAMVSGLLPMPIITNDGEDSGLFGFKTTLVAKADASNGDLTSYADVSAYAALYSADPAAHQNDTIIIDFNQQDTILSDFTGIGTSEYPFSGTIKIANVSGDDGGASTFMLLQAPLFDYIADTAQIVDANINPCTLYLTPATLGANETFTIPLFANHVVGQGNTTSKVVNWSIRIGGSNARSSVIGDLIAGTVNDSPCAPYVNLTFYNVNASVSGTSNLGLVCNSIDSGELELTLSNGAECSSISTTAGNAGGLVGNMESGTTLTIDSDITYSSKREIETSDGYAGGVVGSCKGTVVFGNHTYTDSQETTLITGSTGAGGLFGYLELVSDYTINLDNFIITTEQNDSAPGSGIRATGQYGCVGGVVGRLVNSGTASSPAVIDISGTSMSATDPVLKTTLAARNTYGNGGGLIGVYHANALESSLIIDNLYIQSYGEYVKQYYGGVIAIVESENNCGAYVKIKDVKVYVDYSPISLSNYQDNSISAGLIGHSSNSFIDVCGSVTPMGQIHVGLFYALPSGVVRLSGQTNLSSLTTIASNVLIAANRGNTLIYATGTGTDYDSTNQTGWNYIRKNSGAMDDINPWGQIVRLVDGKAIDDSNSTVATWSSSAHTLTLASTVTSMSTPSDFARTALNIQLNTGGADFGALKFTDQSTSTSSSLLAANLTVTADISLVGTGLTGYTRDNATQDAKTNLNPSIPAISGSGNFTGSFKPSGSDVTIYLATGEAYGYKGSGNAASTSTGVYSGDLVSANNMTGAIVSHRYNGLFAQLGACTIGDTTNTLTIAGSITICTNNKDHHHNIGGLASDISGSPVTIQKVITNETINVSASGNEYDGFLVGNIPNGSAETLTITNCSSTGTANIMCNGAAIGFIGRSVDNNLSTTVNTMTIGSTINYKGSGRPYAGGLLGRIGEKVDETVVYTRNLTLKNVTVENETVNSDITNSSASVYNNPAGGLLGGQWLNTNVYFGTSSINGVTVTSGNLTLTDYADCAGGLVADATGYWQVNKIGITSMTVSGADTALGLLAYKGRVNNGLYLEITSPTAYTITPTSVTSDSPAVYDEIVAYSMYVDGDGLVSEANGQGIVSIRTSEVSGTSKLSMNSSNDNSYQPTTTLGNNHNPNTRYYYNLDYLLTNASTAGEKFLLWSVNQYAASNVKGNAAIGTARTHGFSYYDTLDGAPKDGVATKAVIIDGTSATTVDLANLSYYPVNIGSDLSLNNVTFKLYNSEMQTAHGSKYDLNGTRTGQTVNSQHYLMHAALFKDVTANLTINDMTLQGSASSHGGTTSLPSGSGAIVCGTITGTSADSKQTTTIDGLVLDGIKVNGLGSANDTDALIIRGIGDYVNFNISNVSTTSNYSNGTPAAHYLMGEAAGAGMIINFSNMVLDGRTTASNLYDASATTGNAGALNTAYNTKQSIFDQALFLKSLNYTTSGGSSAKYDYAWTEDWEGTLHQVTYGKEVVDSVEFANKEYQYAPRYNNYCTSPESNSEGSPYADFTNYRPYVYTAYNSTTNYHEIAVNIVDVNLTSGCGTYNDPYIVDASQLDVVARALNGNISTGFYLYIDRDYVQNNNNNLSSAGLNFERWCNGKDYNGHYRYVYNGTNFVRYTYNTASGEWEATARTLTSAQVQQYLAGSYFEIDGNIELGSTFPGLGGNSSANAFRGIIIGKANAETGAYPIITNRSANPLVKISNGCVVKNLDISVTASSIALSTDNVGSNGKFGYGQDNTPYYGAVIGEILGGDNIVDRVKVTFSNATTITVGGTGEVNIPAGAYVGVILNGSLFFRNMTETVAGTAICFANASSTGFKVYKSTDSSKANNLASTTVTYTSETSESFTNLYVNPIIGRVINGVAIYETNAYRYSEDGYYVDSTALSRTETRAASASQTTMKNGRKNFSIPDFNSALDATANATAIANNGSNDGSPIILNFSGDTYTNISVPDAQALYVLSAICQLNAGSANDNASGRDQYNTSYASGYKQNNNTVHLAQYTDIGTSGSDKPSDFLVAKNDETQNTTQVPYIIYKYTNSYTVTISNNAVVKYPARRVLRNDAFEYSITLTGNSDYYLPDCFRGIGFFGGSSNFSNGAYYGANNKHVCMKVKSFNGNGKTIDVNTYFRCYDSDTDNYYGVNASGVGLFNYVIPSGVALSNGIPNSSSTNNGFKNFTLQGYMSAKRVSSSNTIVTDAGNNTNKLWRVGGIAPYESSALTYAFDDISFNNLNLDGSCNTGALFGEYYTSTGTGNVSINNCNADKLKISGTRELGGLIGDPEDCNIYINLKENATGSFKIILHQLPFDTDNNKEIYSGGLLGRKSGNNLVVKNVNVIGWKGSFNSSSTNKPYIGRNVASSETIDIGAADNSADNIASGGIVGMLSSGHNVFDNCHVYGVNIYGYTAGGIVGSLIGGNSNVTNCGLHGASDVDVTISEDTYTVKASFDAGGIFGYDHEECGHSNEDANVSTFSINGVTYNKGSIGNVAIDNYLMEATKNTVDSGVGGVFGIHRNRKLVFNVLVDSCTFKSNGSINSKQGGVAGCSTRYNIYGYNIAILNNTFTASLSNGTSLASYGLILGGIKSQTPNQIMIAGFTSSGNVVNVPFGTVFTSSGDRPVEFIYGRPSTTTSANGLYSNSFSTQYGTTSIDGSKQGSYNPGSFVIYSDYKTLCDGNSKGTSASTVNNSGNVSDANGLLPYAITSPYVELGDKRLTGDGIWVNVSQDTVNVTADQIVSSWTTATTGTETYDAAIYKNFSATDVAIYNQLKEDGKISTYNTQVGSNVLPNDIPVIVMDDSSYEITIGNTTYDYDDAIKAYIRILTNSAYRFDGQTTNHEEQVYSIDLLKCTYSNGSLTTSSSDVTVARSNGGVFSMNTSVGYDSSTNGQFTLLDVKFYDPGSYSTSVSKRTSYAYHLYIPLYTKKMLPFKFDITALSGTSYYPSSYLTGSHFADIENRRGNDSINTVVEDYGTPVTMYMRYEYDLDDIIEDVLGGGYGLNWNYDKSLDFIYNYSDDGALPTGTRFVLVDVNKNDKVNYSSGFTASPGADLDINGTVFPAYSFTDGSGNVYSVVTFAELLNKRGISFTATSLPAANVETTTVPIFHAVVTNASDSAQFSAGGVPDGYSLVPASDNDKTTGTDLYTVTATGGNTLYEDYYLTIYAPAETGDVRHQITVRSNTNLTKTGKVMASCSANDAQILMFANLFTKTISIKTIEDITTDKLMGEGGGDTMTIQAVSTIGFNSTGLGDQMSEVILQLDQKNIPIYHSTQLFMAKTESDNTTQTVAVNGTTYTIVPAATGFTDNMPYNSGVYVTMDDSYEGQPDCYYEYSDEEKTAYYKQMISTSSGDDISGSRITNFYEVKNLNNGSAIDLRPYLTGSDANLTAGAHEVKVVANFTIGYTSAGIEGQFPIREGDSTAGTTVSGQASLAYTPDGTTYSNTTSLLTLDTQARKYYRNPTSKTKLSYNVILGDLLTSTNAQVKTNDMLGINPKDEGTGTTVTINTYGDYNATQLIGASTCSNIKWTLSLYRREPVDGGAEYGTALPIQNYLTNIKVYGIDENGDKDISKQIALTFGDGTTELEYTAARANFEDVTIRVDPEDSTELTNKFMVYVDYDVKTGSGIETPGYFYSNYKVILTGELVGDSSSVASDHIIYTNARLDPTFIDTP